MKYIYIDPKEKIIIRQEDKRVMEVIFYDSLLNNIYRGKVVNKIDSLSSYFVQISDNENLFLKSSLSYAIGDNVIIEYVREPANGKLGLASENFSLENESYKIKRYPIKAKAKRKYGKKKDDILFEELNDKKAWLINEEKFFPSPKLLIENSKKDSYIKKYKDYEIK
ncbi:ribonuclease G, partial [Anaerococcus sp. NML200537]|nr:ribonuclease G [Anaerococcus sp. NML200537]